MQKQCVSARVFWYQSFGFLTIMGLGWLDELVGLGSLILGHNDYIFRFRQSALEMLLVLAVWLLVAGATRRLCARLRHVESFMRVCAWCRRIDYGNRWMKLEDFLRHGFDTPTSHGICDECLAKQKAAIALAKARKHQANRAVVQPVGTEAAPGSLSSD